MTGGSEGVVLSLALVWAASLVACAQTPEQHTLVVLLAGSDGTTGKVVVEGEKESRVLDAAGEATSVSGGRGVPSEPFIMEEEEVGRIFGTTLEAQPERPAVFVLYFEQDADELTPESQALVERILEAIDLRSSVDTSVVGHTDTIGAKDYNYELSSKRAATVRDILVGLGVNPEILQVTSHGEENLLVPTPDETAEPRNRRVEVTVR